jgi:hypothetical protein
MMKRSRIFSAAAFVSVNLSLAALWAQPATGPVIHVWKVGSPHRGDVPAPFIPPALDAEARRLGFQFDMHVLHAKDFASAFFEARATNDEPDMLVFDNMGHIEGITTPLGSFEGIGSDPNVRAVLVKVSESLKAFQPAGWEYLLRTSKRYAEAKALATGPIDCGPRRTSSETISGALSKTAEQAVVAYFHSATATFADLVSGDAADTAIHLPHDPRSIVDVGVCNGWGNDQFAFLEVVAAFEGRDEIGYRTFLAASASVDGRPRVLMLGDSTTIIPTLQREAPRLLNEPAAGFEPPLVLTPEDGASASRMPPASRPMVAWTSRGAAFCLIEWQFGQGKGGNWEGSGFAFVSNGSSMIDKATQTSIRAPFGVGRQPHRWRIWAVSDHGDVARSPWRILFYTN